MKQQRSEDGWQGFLDLCADIEDSKILDQFFELFFTFEERSTMASRYLIIKGLLEEKLTQREMAETYKVSIAQITRGSNALKMIGPKLKKALKEKIS